MTPETAIIPGLCVALAVGILIAVSRHKKSSTGRLALVGSIGIVDKALEPQGTVIIQGELWRASLNEGTGLATGSKVEVTGTSNHLLLVKLHAQ
jgi:membrane-bound ClpP family serine protease